MVLFANALFISFSQPHHYIVIVPFYVPLQPSSFRPCNVLVSSSAGVASRSFLFAKHAAKLSLHPSSFNLCFYAFAPSHLPLIPFSITFTSLFHFFLIPSPVPIAASPSHIPPILFIRHSLRCVTECWCPDLSNGIILCVRAAASVRLHVAL